MLTTGDIVDLDLGSPRDREAGLSLPVVVVTAEEILDQSANGVLVVPLSWTIRPFASEVGIHATRTMA
jgi:mRNA interferase MazF